MTLEEAQRRWPTLVRDVPCGWYCPDTWDEPIAKLCDLLVRIPGITCAQCKVKFGGLRFYLDYDEAVSDETALFASRLAIACEAACQPVLPWV